jgi:hypothetical protein
VHDSFRTSKQTHTLGVQREVRHRPFLRRPDAAARKLVEPANAFEPIQDGRIYIEKVNEPSGISSGAHRRNTRAGLLRAIENGWLEPHESGTFVRFTPAGALLFA